MNNEELKIDESQIDEYEEVQEALAKYDDIAAKLLDTIAKRDEMVKLLPIAAPPKIAAVRENIQQWNNLIAQTEELLELQRQSVEHQRELTREYLTLQAMTELVEPELKKYLAEHNPEKLEELERLQAMRDDDGKTH